MGRPISSISTDGSDFLSGGGEMAAYIRSVDWSSSPLGPPNTWPQSLRTTVSLCLASNFPINIIWGPEHTQIYNDGYRVVCGDAHPAALGEDFTKTWASAWPAVGQPFERALLGETSYLENQRMFLFRNGYLEETFFTFSLSPIRDESGGIGGLFHPVNETTATMLAERRTRAVRDLNARLGEARTTADVGAFAIDTLRRYEFDLPFVLIYELSAETQDYRLAGQVGLEPGSPVAPPVMALDTAAPWPVAQLVRDREAIIIEDDRGLANLTLCGPYEEPPKAAFATAISIPGSDLPAALMVAGLSARLPLNDAYRSFCSLLAAALTAGMANANYYEEQQRRAEALAALDRAKTAFFSNVSHEFRTPLTLLLGPIEDVLEDAQDLPTQQRERLDVAHRNAQRLLKLVNSLLDFSRIEAGRMSARFQPTDLGAFTAELVSNFRSACDRVGLRLVVDCPPLSQPVFIDRPMWEKVVLNLVSNAFKFTLAGEIEVTLKAQGDHVALRVRDTGVGMTAEELPRVFERFHRIEGQKGRTHEGTGIGLALVEELVKLHGGRVSADSTLDMGSVFQVTVPFGKAHLPQDQIAEDQALAPSSVNNAFVAEALRWTVGSEGEEAQIHAPVEGRPLVVLADDNADMRRYVQRLLEQGGYDVVAVQNGLEALDAVRRGAAPDLVLSDVMMPELDGFGLLSALRADPALKDLLVILLSARAGEEARVEGLAAGADDYLVKPFSARELRARVDGAVTLARQRREAAKREKVLQTEIASAWSQAALQRTEQQLEFALEAGQLGRWDFDRSAGRLTISDLCRQSFGVGTDTPLDTYRDMVALVVPEDHERLQSAVERTLAEGAELNIDLRTIRANGQVGWVLIRGRGIHAEGEAVRLTGVTLDITELKEAENRQKLLLDELNHRVKNTLATVFSVALQTRRYVTDPAAFDAAFLSRLEALARAHDLLTEGSWEGASLEVVLARTLAPYFSVAASDRVEIKGPGVRLGPNAAVTLNMAFHELATNAAKYGALSEPAGRVAVTWRVAGNAVKIDWRESGGPQVSAPTRRGFGSRLIEQGLGRELAGEARLDFEAKGLRCHIHLPLSAKLGLGA